MFSKRDIEIQSREESNIALVVRSLTERLSNPEVLKGNSKHVFIKETKEALEGAGRFEVPKGITDYKPRVSNDMDRFFANLAYIQRRELSRILQGYSILNQLETRILSTDNNIEGIPTKINTIINKILVQNKQRSILEDNINVLDFTDTDDVESGTAYHDTESGSVTLSVEMNDVTDTTSVDVVTSRPVYLTNIYESYSDETQEFLFNNVGYYDFQNLPIDIIWRFTGKNPLDIVQVALDVPFIIKDITVDIDGNDIYTSIKNQTFGTTLSIKGQTYIEPNYNSEYKPDGSNIKSIMLPSPYNVVNVTATVNVGDLYPASLLELRNNHSQKIKTYDIRQTKILTGDLRTNDISLVKSLLEESKTGSLVSVLTMLPFRKITPLQTASYISSSKSTGLARFKTTTGGRKIQSVEIFVSSYDPLQQIKYYVDPTRNDRIPISPVNSNSEIVNRVTFENSLPTSLSIIAEIPNSIDYTPIIKGLIIRLKENIV